MLSQRAFISRSKKKSESFFFLKNDEKKRNPDDKKKTESFVVFSPSFRRLKNIEISWIMFKLQGTWTQS